MLEISKSGAIKLTRGDTADLVVEIESDEGSYTLASGDSLTMTCRKFASSEEVIFQKQIINSNSFRIEPEDTANVPFGKYVFDVQLSTVGGEIYTVISPKTFEICEEVTY